ncbi:MAG: phosphodiesterase [Eubacteriales bacterium]
MLNPMKEKLLSVRGNCEAEVDQMVLDFPVLADYAALYIDGYQIFATHGHVYNEKNLPPIAKNTIFLNGHTHVSKFTDHGDYVYANPGSVSIPKEDTPRGYIVFEDGTLTWKTLDGEEYMKHQAKKA